MPTKAHSEKLIWPATGSVGTGVDDGVVPGGNVGVGVFGVGVLLTTIMSDGSGVTDDCDVEQTSESRYALDACFAPQELTASTVHR